MALPGKTLYPLCEQFLARDSAAHIQLQFHMHTAIERGVPREFFDHTLMFLGALRCWHEKDSTQPWHTTIRYKLAPTALTTTPPKDAKVTLDTDDKGATRELCVRTIPLQTTFKLPNGLNVTASVVVSEPQIYKLKKDATFTNVVIQKVKRFHFTSSFAWTYTLTLEWSAPVQEIHSQDENVDASMIFPHPPTFALSLECNHPCKHSNVQYLVDSILCKVTDLVPHSTIMTTSPGKSVEGSETGGGGGGGGRCVCGGGGGTCTCVTDGIAVDDEDDDDEDDDFLDDDAMSI